jgi:hypothetical protein
MLTYTSTPPGGTVGEETHGQVARNTVFHDATRASHILLPVYEEM